MFYWISPILMFLISVTSVLAAGNDQTYWVRLPESPEGCAQAAENVALRFARATGTSEVKGECRGVVELTAEGEVHRLFSVIVSYPSATELRPNSVVFGRAQFGSQPSRAAGVFPSYRSCLDQIPAQSAIYEEETGLEAVAAFCFPAGLRLGPDGKSSLTNYALQIDGFGKTASRLRVFDAGARGGMGDRGLAQAASIVQRLGARVALLQGTHIFYYSEQGLSMSLESLAHFSRQNECEVQKDEAESILRKLGSREVLVNCVNSDSSWSLMALREKVSMFSRDFGASAPKYYTFDECLSDRSRVLGREGGYRAPLGAICRSDSFSDFYVMELFRHL